MNFYIIAVFFFYCFNILASGDGLYTQKIQELKSTVNQAAGYVESNQSSFTVSDYTQQSAKISDALLKAGCKRNCLTGCMYSVATCATTCFPMCSARMCYNYTLFLAQQYMSSAHQSSDRYTELSGHDEL